MLERTTTNGCTTWIVELHLRYAHWYAICCPGLWRGPGRYLCHIGKFFKQGGMLYNSLCLWHITLYAHGISLSMLLKLYHSCAAWGPAFGQVLGYTFEVHYLWRFARGTLEGIGSGRPVKDSLVFECHCANVRWPELCACLLFSHMPFHWCGLLGSVGQLKSLTLRVSKPEKALPDPVMCRVIFDEWTYNTI